MSAFPKAVEDLIWDRCGGLCEKCGLGLLRGQPDTTPYSLQHRRARGMGGSRDIVTQSVSNGVLLCGFATTPGSCHLWCEQRPERPLGFVLKQYENPQLVPIRHWSGRDLYLLPDGNYGEEVWAA